MRNRRIIKIKIREENTNIWINKKSVFASEVWVKLIEEAVIDLLKQLGAVNFD